MGAEGVGRYRSRSAATASLVAGSMRDAPVPERKFMDNLRVEIHLIVKTRAKNSVRFSVCVREREKGGERGPLVAGSMRDAPVHRIFRNIRYRDLVCVCVKEKE